MSKFDTLNRFAINPVSIDSIGRSQFNRDNSHKLTMNSGVLVPFYIDETTPGDTFKLNVAAVVRSITPVAPVMDNSFIDIQFYFVPMRLCTLHEHDWEKVYAQESFNTAWAPESEQTLVNTGNVMAIKDLGSHGGIVPQSLANYLGLPILSTAQANGFENSFISTLPFMAYWRIWNDWFRDENTEAPIVDFATRFGYIGAAYSSSAFSNGQTGLCPVSKYSDYFTSSLRAPQRGESVLLPLFDKAPVINTNETHAVDLDARLQFDVDRDVNGITAGFYTGPVQTGGPVRTYLRGFTASAGDTWSLAKIVPNNLWADLTNATAASINDLRFAFALQRLREKSARGGMRYREYIYTNFGVKTADSRVQVPEYLFGRRIPLNINTVLQTSGTTDVSPLGDTGAMGYTQYAESAFIKSFTEAGYVVGVACIRTQQSYSQGLPRMFTRFRQYDFYNPTFANIGEQPVYTRELYLKGLTDSNYDRVFGYQEAWADYRYKSNQVSGYLAPDSGDNVLGHWTYTTDFTALPVLNSDFMHQDRSNIDDTLVVTNSSYQFICDFYVDNKAIRPMPLFSIPGLIDHH